MSNYTNGERRTLYSAFIARLSTSFFPGPFMFTVPSDKTIYRRIEGGSGRVRKQKRQAPIFYGGNNRKLHLHPKLFAFDYFGARDLRFESKMRRDGADERWQLSCIGFIDEGICRVVVQLKKNEVQVLLSSHSKRHAYLLQCSAQVQLLDCSINTIKN